MNGKEATQAQNTQETNLSKKKIKLVFSNEREYYYFHWEKEKHQNKTM